MVNPIAQKRDSKAESQRGEGSVQGLTAGPPLHDLSPAGILPHSLATDRGRDGEASGWEDGLWNVNEVRRVPPRWKKLSVPVFLVLRGLRILFPIPLVWAPPLSLLPSACLPTISVS